MKKTARIVGVAATAMLVATLSTSPAQAAPANRSCDTTGADGFIYFFDWGNGPVTDLKLEWHLDDTLADGHHTRIRFLSKQHDGTVHRWPWHKNTGGKGHHEWAATTASDDYGIFSIGVEVARYEGDTKLNSCTHWG
ncbi:hypothetical protein HLK59_40375 [Streptomyces sp. S3(2020)]|uniref:hypothetical protein n=1 Tax=Streptomyces sp. S3(2020) TaxID=2732044 RepID=UPI001488A0A3|nr:hypothetical protein [Streptomyces sp. S3(2020)]NNN36508.1 hypothetical protein [Streptomyces sp. S3(2020)]